jgi:hypothetical protein
MTDDVKVEGERILRLGLAQEAGRAVAPITLRMLPALAVTFLYGTVNVVAGTDTSRWVDAYIPALGSALSLAGIFAYTMAMPFGRSLLGMLLALAGFVPYLFALFIIALGVGRLYGLLSGFSVGGLVGGIFWLGVGYWLLYWFWVYTEAVAAVDKARKAVLARYVAAPVGSDPQKPN